MSPETNDLRGVLERLEKVEKQNRTMSLILLAAGLLGIVAVLSGQAGPKKGSMEAETLVLRDETGKKRIEFTGKSGAFGPGLSMYDEAGKIVVWLRGGRSDPSLGPELSFFSKVGPTPPADSGTSSREMVAVLTDRLVTLGIDVSGNPRLTLTNNEKTASASLLATNSMATISAESTSGDRRGASMSFGTSFGSVLTVNGSKPPLIATKNRSIDEMFKYGSASIYLTEDGAGCVEIKDSNGRSRAVLGSTDLVVTRTEETRQRPPSSLVLFDKDGKVMWSAP